MRLVHCRLLPLVVLAIQPCGCFDFAASWASLVGKVDESVNTLQETVSDIDWEQMTEGMTEKAKEAYDASKSAVEGAVGAVQSYNWTTVEMQAKGAYEFSKDVAQQTIHKGQVWPTASSRSVRVAAPCPIALA